MVERPIKKSERQAQSIPDAAPESTESSAAPQSTESQSVESKSPPPKPVRRSSESKSSEESDRGGRRTDRASGRGRKGDKEEPRQAMNPALMRGPKPVQPKPAPERQPEEAISAERNSEGTVEESQEDVTSEESQENATSEEA